MNHRGSASIKTERLTLRKLEAKDAASLFCLGALGATREEADGFMRDMVAAYSDPAYYHWGIAYDSAVIGRIRVTELSERDRFVQLGYDMAGEFRNRGFMTEAVRAVTRFLFDEVGVNRIYVLIRAHNTASIRVAQKSGMTWEGCMRRHYIENDGTYTDVNVYGILKEECPK